MEYCIFSTVYSAASVQMNGIWGLSQVNLVPLFRPITRMFLVQQSAVTPLIVREVNVSLGGIVAVCLQIRDDSSA